MTWVSGESSDNLRGSPSCTAVLYRHNNTCALIIHQKHVHTRTHTLTQQVPVIQQSPLFSLIWNVVTVVGCSFFSKEGTSSVIMTERKTSWGRPPPPLHPKRPPRAPPPALSQPPHWLLISNSWVTSWEICEWTVQPGSYLALQISAPCRTMRHNNGEAALPASFTT